MAGSVIQDRNHFPIWLAENGLTGTGCEVGLYYGQFAEHILKNWPGKLVSVDPFINYPKEIWLDGCALVNLEEAMVQALKTLEPFGDRFRLVRKPSVEAVEEFPDASLDFVYIDANHDYRHVIEDIRLWWPKVECAGVLGGHDFGTRHDAYQRLGVEQAVKKFAASQGLPYVTTPCSSWWIHKP